MGAQGTHNDRAQMIGRHVLCANLNDARSTLFAVGKQNAKIKVVREYDAPVVARPLHDLPVRCVVGSHGRPMDRLESMQPKKRRPLGRQVHVDEERHAAASGTSRSSTRHAA